MANFKKFSRYSNGKVSENRNGDDFLLLREPIDLEEDEGDVVVTVSNDVAGRPDLIAQRAYGNPDLWWVIYEFNEIKDPLFDLKAGDIIRIPEKERVVKAVENLGK